MRFWDTSAVVPLLVVEAGTRVARSLLEDDPGIVVWWGTRVECVSALARQARLQVMSTTALTSALKRLAGLTDRWSEIIPTEALRSSAERIVRIHPLRAADAVQLAAALIAGDGLPAALPFVSLDLRLREAAQREGFSALPEVMPALGVVRERSRRRGR